MRITEILTESSKICPQCGMRSCTCKPGTCKCKPKPGYPKNIDEGMFGRSKNDKRYLDKFDPTEVMNISDDPGMKAHKTTGKGSLRTSKEDLEFAFGPPGEDDTWVLEFSNGLIATIYPQDNSGGMDWIIGGNHSNTEDFVHMAYSAAQDEKLEYEQGVAEGEVIPMQPRNPLNKNLIIQLKALSETALEIFWEGSYVPTAAQGQMAQLSQQEQNKIFKQNVAQFKALGYETSIFEDDMDILFLHSIAREAWYDSKKPMSKYRGLPDLEYNSDTNSLKIIDLIGDDDKGIVYDKNVYEQDVAGGLNEFSLSNNDGNGDEKSYLLHLASDLSNALYVLKNKQAVKDVKDKIIASGGDVKITWNDDGSFNVVMYHPTYFKQGYLISLVGKGKQQDVDEDWQKVNKKDKTDGMSGKAVKAYRKENPGSKLKTAVTKKPSELKAGSKDANRRKSFCARMSGMKKHNASAETKKDPDSPINKALRRWNC